MTKEIANPGANWPAGKPQGSRVSLKIVLNEKLYLRDPQDSRLGRNILRDGIALLDELGLEEFTFRKLAVRMDSTEASVYRYFANKHNLLVYLSSYYWAWIRYHIDTENRYLDEPLLKLEHILNILVNVASSESGVEYIDLKALHRIIVSESTKVYHTKSVDDENRQGFFLSYKELCWVIAETLSVINPDYPYPRALATTLMEMAKNHIHFAQHLPRLTDIRLEGDNYRPALDLLRHFAYTQLGVPIK
jgi:AcrR family transcriptional regulator